MDNFVEFVKEHSMDTDMMFSMNALLGELGELANVVKKEHFYTIIPNYRERVDKEITEGKRDTFLDKFVDEAGDALFYFIQVLNKRGVNIDNVMDAQEYKMQELSFRSNNKLYKK